MFHGYFVHCKQYCKTFSVLSYCKQYCKHYCTSCSNSKGKKTDLLFTEMLLNVNITCGHTVPNQEIECKNGGLHVLHVKTET